MVGIVSVFALITSLTGNILVNYRKRSGFIIWSVSNVLWITVNFISTLNIAQVLMYMVYLLLNLQGFIVWGRKTRKQIDKKSNSL